MSRGFGRGRTLVMSLKRVHERRRKIGNQKRMGVIGRTVSFPYTRSPSALNPPHHLALSPPHHLPLIISPPSIDTEAPSASEPTTDAFSLLEKTTTQSTLALTKSQRLDSLFALSYRQTSDPYTMSQHLRARHRLEKRADQDQANADEAVVNKYGLPDHIPLARVDPSEGKSEWAVQATRSTSRKIPIPGDLSTTLRRNTVERYNPFDRGRGSSETIGKIGRGRGVVKVVSGGSGPKVARGVVPVAAPVYKSGGLVGLTGYESEEEDDEDAA